MEQPPETKQDEDVEVTDSPDGLKNESDQPQTDKESSPEPLSAASEGPIEEKAHVITENSNARAYLRAMNEPLQEGLLWLVKNRPEKPLESLGKWLIEHSRVLEQKPQTPDPPVRVTNSASYTG
eukprot:Trichotokara_eunicae@DN6241_c0_g2_i1.p1